MTAPHFTMKIHRITLGLLALLAGLAAGSVAIAHDGKDHANKVTPTTPELVAPTDQDAAWLAKARESYPLKTCPVSGDGLGGDMGETIDRIYREKDKPDRLVRFCCESCMDDFKKDPAQYLKLIDEAGKPAGAAATYVCPMHSDVTSTNAGDKCSKCGMALVPAKPNKAKHHH